MQVDDLKVERAMESYLKKDESGDPQYKWKLPQNYLTCYHFFIDLPYLAATIVTGGFKVKRPSSGTDEHKITIPPTNPDPQTSLAPEKESKKSLDPGTVNKEDQDVPANYTACYEFVKFAYLHILGLSGVGISAIRNIKQKHKWGGQLLSAFMERPYESYMGSGGQPIEEFDDEDEDETDPFTAYAEIKQRIQKNVDKNQKNETDTKHDPQRNNETEPEAEEKFDRKETAFLIAARNGIVEMVTAILSRIPSALHDTTSDKKNVFLVAVKNRQPLVVEALRKNLSKQNIENLIQAVDNQENTVLHLAAETISSEKVWQIGGSAMQMMWDIKWFQYIKDLVPDHFIFRSNKDEKTAGVIFKESHKELIKDSSEWLKDTSESCSVVAALIAGVSFATASTVPGGNVETGKPALEGQPAFDAFAISSLIGLCVSVTALIMFLSILTSRKEAKDFRKDLPLKMLLGLSSLFVSIAAMFVSFCAGHFFVLKDKYKNIQFPIYAATCLPVTFYAVAQFPLYVDLLKGILKKVPQPSDTGEYL